MDFLTLCTYSLTYLAVGLANKTELTFHWLENDSRFNCIVGIAVENQPVGIGTLIYDDLIVTSANPLEQYLERNGSSATDHVDPQNIIKVFAINKMWNANKELETDRFTANVSKRDKVWIRLGFEKKHTVIHDLIFISIKKDQVKNLPVPAHEAFYLHASFQSFFKTGWTFAGFGYATKDHVANSTLLEMTVYEDADEVDCDEWIPRPWGRFVCLLNSENVYAVQSGAPLFQNGTLRGIGSFHLKKGKESILVFTDFSLYRMLFYDEEPSTTTQSPDYLL